MIGMIYNNTFRYVFAGVMKVMPPPAPKVFKGQGATEELCRHIADAGSKRILMLTSPELVDLGLVAPYLEIFEQLGVKVKVFDKIEPNPSITSVEQAIATYHQEECQAVFAFGGGSVIDAGKAAVLQISNNVPIKKLIGLFKGWKKPIPFYVTPTTAGTGSEVTSAAVLSDSNHKKVFIFNHKAIPLATSLDPVPMAGLPNFITADTGMDVLTHAVEAYISKVGSAEMKAEAVTAVKMVFENLPEAYANGTNLEARENMAVASFKAGVAFNAMGLGFVHAISHQLTGYYQVPHGRANAVVLPHVLTASFDAIVPQLAQLSREVGFAERESNEVALARRFIDEVHALSRKINIPVGINEIKEQDIAGIIKGARAEAIQNYPVPTLLSTNECKNILQTLAVA